MAIYKVNSADAALELAKKFQADGTFDLFRGQVKNWPLVSSFGRQNKKKRKECEAEYHRFFRFCSENEILKTYLTPDSYDKIIGIAQHYGIPTNFVDFTSNVEVAMSFATHRNRSRIEKKVSLFV